MNLCEYVQYNNGQRAFLNYVIFSINENEITHLYLQGIAVKRNLKIRTIDNNIVEMFYRY